MGRLGRTLEPDGTLTLAGDAQQQTDETTVFPGWARAWAIRAPCCRLRRAGRRRGARFDEQRPSGRAFYRDPLRGIEADDDEGRTAPARRCRSPSL